MKGLFYPRRDTAAGLPVHAPTRPAHLTDGKPPTSHAHDPTHTRRFAATTRRQNSVLLAGLLAAVTACADQPRDPVSPTSEAVASRDAGDERTGAAPYIVVLREDANPRSIAAIAGVDPNYVYESVLNGFAANLTPGKLQALRANPAVSYVEADAATEVEGTTQFLNNAYGDPWGIDRLDQRPRPLSKSYTYNYTGSGVYVYVIDTGLQANHPEFEGRAKNVWDAWGGSGNDCHGHGTHAGGTIGGKTWGLAKKVQLRGVRVSDCKGSGTTSKLIAGLDWVRANRRNPAVANLSVSSTYSATLNNAVAKLISSGVFVAISAGNNGRNACNYSPGSLSSGFTVAASTSTDYRASYSNYGSCVDAYAPGSSIMSAWIGSGSKLMSGTSMSAPHVTGIAALYKHKYGNASSATIDSWLKNNASSGLIKNNPSGTANRLVFKANL